MAAKKLKLLIVEDEESILSGLVDVFVYHGYEVESAMDGGEGLAKALAGDFDGIILDVMLPTMDGFTVCNKIREKNKDVPIVMLTAKASEDDIVNGLRLGADDYIPKPFSVRVLTLRVEAVLRRSRKADQIAAEIRCGDALTIDTENLVGKTADGEQIDFTRREVEVIQYLYAERERPVSRDELLVKVWGYSPGSRIETRTVDIHIAKIRRKIEKDPKDPEFLVTVRGKGYRLDGCDA